MGVWGTGVFSDDTACDIREEYRALVGSGQSGTEATNLLLKEWSHEADDEARGVFWLALAATQWKCGRLESRVKREALKVIEDGTDLTRWEGRQIGQRRAALEKLRQQLLSPEPAPRKLRKRFQDSCNREVGEFVGYRLKSQKWIVLRVTGHHKDKGGMSPTVEVLRFVGEEIPNAEALHKLPVWVREDLPDRSQLTLARAKTGELDLDRVKRLHIIGRPELCPRKPIHVNGTTIWKCFDTFVLWRFLDNVLKESFGLV